MELRYLGTAAAEALPAMFCSCEGCRRARALGGRNLRTRSQAIVDGKLLIDFGPDTLYHTREYGIDLLDVENCVVTHAHDDHLTPTETHYATGVYAHPPKGWRGFHVWGSPDVGAALAPYANTERGQLVFHEMRPFETYRVGEYEVTPLVARHGTEHPYIYLIAHGETTLLYAHDTGLFPEETMAYLLEKKPRLGLVSFDCTGGAAEELSYPTHMCLGRAERVREALREGGLVSEKTVCVLNHFSHNSVLPVYEDLVPVARERGFEVSYDGMTVSF